jgi:hypothetical protein
VFPSKKFQVLIFTGLAVSGMQNNGMNILCIIHFFEKFRKEIFFIEIDAVVEKIPGESQNNGIVDYFRFEKPRIR